MRKAIRAFIGKIKKLFFDHLTGILIFLLIVLIVLIPFGYPHEWTGFGATTIPTSPTGEIQPPKKLWDWLGLLVVPAILALSALLFSRAERRSEQTISERRIEEERKIADNRAEDEALQAYFEQMSIFLLDKGLRESEAGSEVRHLASAWTSTFLRRLTGERKGILLRFVQESDLATKGKLVISLSNTDLRNADLHRADLSYADLSEADLSGADLSEATLGFADLSSANLSRANLLYANLTHTSLINTNLTHASLRANISYSNLRGADLSYADLTYATLTEAALNHTILRYADLRGADLTNSALSGADLRNATLSEATLNGVILLGATYNKETQWPDGFDPASHGAILTEE